MEPPRGEREPRTTNRSSRLLGLLAAVGFSIAMWVFIAMAVLGLILKVVGPKGAEEGLAAAGITLPEGFGLDSNTTDSANAPSGDPTAAATGDITKLNGQVLAPAPDPGKPPEAPAKAPPTPAPN